MTYPRAPLVPVGGEHHGLHVGCRLRDALDGGDAVDARQPNVDDHDLRLQALHRRYDFLAGLDAADQLEVGRLSEHQAESLAHRRVVIHGQTPRRCAHRSKH
jgi:hypothetical protein